MFIIYPVNLSSNWFIHFSICFSLRRKGFGVNFSYWIWNCQQNRDWIILALLALMGTAVGEFIKIQEADWDDDVVTSARFKALNGQRSDWEARFKF